MTVLVKVATVCVGFAMMIGVVSAQPATDQTATQTQPQTPPAAHLSAALPTAAGHTRLRYYTNADGTDLDMCVVVSVSKKVSTMQGKVPALLFFHGGGEAGTDGDRIFDAGPAAEMQRHPNLNEDLPVMVISPQFLPGHGWTSAGMDVAMSRFVELLLADGRIDPDRFYVTGLSAGGRQAYWTAANTPGMFAALAVAQPGIILDKPLTTAPAANRIPLRSEIVDKIKGLPIWIVAGAKDERFAADSRTMYDALTKAGADVTYSQLDSEGHQSWEQLYPKPEFYQWLIAHVRGQAPARKFTSDELLRIAATPLDDPIGDKLAKDLETFAPYWQMVNCSRDPDVGLHDDISGQKNVMVLRPLNPTTACHLQTIWKIPAGKHALLHVIAGRAGAGAGAGGDWQLCIIRDGKEALSKTITTDAVANGWFDTTIDMGTADTRVKNSRMEVLIRQSGNTPAPAYLAKLAVEVQ